MNIPRNTPAERVIPVTKWPEYHDWPSVAGLRWLIFNREKNGLVQAGAIRRAGRRVLIDEAAFFRWMKGGQGAPCPSAGEGAGKASARW